MASEANPVQGFARVMDSENVDGKLTFQEALHAVQALKMDGPDHPKPFIKRLSKGSLTIGDLPLRFLNEAGTNLMAFGDVLLNQGKFNLDEVEKHLSKLDYDNLPEALTLKKKLHVPYYPQYFIIPDAPPADEPNTVLKMYYLQPNRIHVSEVKEVCRRQPMQIDYSKQFRNGQMALEWMLNDLGGFQSRLLIHLPKQEKKTKVQKPEAPGLVHQVSGIGDEGSGQRESGIGGQRPRGIAHRTSGTGDRAPGIRY